MKNVDSVLQFADAAIIERINYEMAKVLENIQNVNTDEKPRKLVIEMDFTPINARREVSAKMTVKKKLRPTNAVYAQMAMAKLEDNTMRLVETGSGYVDGQADIFGEIHETKVLSIKKSEE